MFTLNLHFVWCPTHRKLVLTGAVATRLDERLRAKAEALAVATGRLDTVTAATIRRSIAQQPTRS